MVALHKEQFGRGPTRATDPDVNMVFEVVAFEPEAAENNGRVSLPA